MPSFQVGATDSTRFGSFQAFMPATCSATCSFKREVYLPQRRCTASVRQLEGLSSDCERVYGTSNMR